jgi:hypothetical protein
MHPLPSGEYSEHHLQRRSLLSYCLERDTLLFSLKMAFVVGTLLAVINHGQALLTGHVTLGLLISLLLTYCVPFAVAMYSQVKGKQQRDLTEVGTARGEQASSIDEELETLCESEKV